MLDDSCEDIIDKPMKVIEKRELKLLALGDRFRVGVGKELGNDRHRSGSVACTGKTTPCKNRYKELSFLKTTQDSSVNDAQNKQKVATRSRLVCSSKAGLTRKYRKLRKTLFLDEKSDAFKKQLRTLVSEKKQMFSSLWAKKSRDRSELLDSLQQLDLNCTKIHHDLAYLQEQHLVPQHQQYLEQSQEFKQKAIDLLVSGALP